MQDWKQITKRVKPTHVPGKHPNLLQLSCPGCRVLVESDDAERDTWSIYAGSEYEEHGMLPKSGVRRKNSGPPLLRNALSNISVGESTDQPVMQQLESRGEQETRPHPVRWPRKPSPSAVPINAKGKSFLRKVSASASLGGPETAPLACSCECGSDVPLEFDIIASKPVLLMTSGLAKPLLPHGLALRGTPSPPSSPAKQPRQSQGLGGTPSPPLSPAKDVCFSKFSPTTSPLRQSAGRMLSLALGKSEPLSPGIVRRWAGIGIPADAAVPRPCSPSSARAPTELVGKAPCTLKRKNHGKRQVEHSLDLSVEESFREPGKITKVQVPKNGRGPEKTLPKKQAGEQGSSIKTNLCVSTESFSQGLTELEHEHQISTEFCSQGLPRVSDRFVGIPETLDAESQGAIPESPKKNDVSCEYSENEMPDTFCQQAVPQVEIATRNNTPNSPSRTCQKSIAEILDDPDVSLQMRYGPQSKRGKAPQHQREVISRNPHALHCFDLLDQKESEMCGEYAVFYHSYAHAAPLYEVHAAIAAVLFGYDSVKAPLPRLIGCDFESTPDSASLLSKFRTEFVKKNMDHSLEYRKVAISAMCSLVSLGPECSIPVCFLHGYSEQDVPYAELFSRVLELCEIPKKKIKKTARQIVTLCQKHGLDMLLYGGAKTDREKRGHLLQIFVKRVHVDSVAYASHPYGKVDPNRNPIRSWLDTDSETHFGQARVVANPAMFMSPTCVQMNVVSSDSAFERTALQADLVVFFHGIFSSQAIKEQVIKNMFGESVPHMHEGKFV